jgi:hypothetical protein
MEAVMRNHSTFAEILVQAGADLNLQDNVRDVNVAVYGQPASVYSSPIWVVYCRRKQDGKTARMHAAAEGNASVVQMLLHAGARRDLYDKVKSVRA